MPRTHYAAETFIKNHPDGLLKPIVGKYLAENGHDIRRMTIDKLTRLTLRTDDLYIQIEEMPIEA